MVRDGGLEPPHLAAYAPQAYVSTSSTNRAKSGLITYSEAYKANQTKLDLGLADIDATLPFDYIFFKKKKPFANPIRSSAESYF